MFLSGGKIAEDAGAWITPFHPEHIDCAAYTMRIGDEAYVSPEGRGTRKPGLVQQLVNKAPILIPPGQFAYLTTREFVSLPQDVLGFINMKSSLKNSGLVNVSGFHVDPGYKGKLIFAVFNAGPQTITVRCGQNAFLIWFARLEDATEKYARKKEGFHEIDTTLMGLIPAETASLNSVTKRIDAIDRRITYILGILTLIGLIFTGTIACFLGEAVLKMWKG